MMGYWQSRALAVAAELDLAGLLADGPQPVDSLAARTSTDSLSLFRLMRALESLGVFTQVSPRVFANTPASDCLRKDVPGSQWPSVRMILSTGHGQLESWSGLLGSVQTGGIAFEPMYGVSYWQFLQKHPDVWDVFNQAMRALSDTITPAAAGAFDWSRFPVIADIGGGIGTQLVAILDRHPSCRGILFDQPDVVAGAIPHDRVERVGGDFFQPLPAGADAYVLRWIIHDWAEPQAIAILRNVRAAMKPDSRVVLIESVMPETAESTFGKWLDLHMMVLVGGRERTPSEYGELLAKAGLELEEIIPVPAPSWVIVARAA
jgi:hypothetical protein